MNILITGATGFVGKRLVRALLNESHGIYVVSRSADTAQIAFQKRVKALTWNELDTFDRPIDIVINLAGFNISKRRWRTAVKNTIINSRVEATQRICSWIKKYNPQAKLFNASALSAHDDAQGLFLHEVAKQWEAAIDSSIDHVIMRFAVVLSKNEGAFKQMLIPYKMKSGNILGDGQQAFAWIYIDDLINAILFLINNSESHGAYDLVAPEIPQQIDFARALSKKLHCFFNIKLPKIVIKALMGEMGQALLLQGQTGSAQKLLGLGFQFQCPTVIALLEKEFP